MDYKNISEKNINEHIDNIINIAESIELNKVTILTGGNGCGKSVVRKLLTSIIKEKVKAIYNEEINTPLVASVSMETRTASRPDFYALSSILLAFFHIFQHFLFFLALAIQYWEYNSH